MNSPRAPYPKTAYQITVQESKQSLELDSQNEDVQSRNLNLGEKLEEYLIKLGYSNAHVLGIIVQLLTRGKVRVEFRSYYERIMLADIHDRLSRAQAVTLFDDFISGMNSNESSEEHLGVTQKIVVQPPKP